MVGVWTRVSQRCAESLLYSHLHSGTLSTLGAQEIIPICSFLCCKNPRGLREVA